MNCPSCGLENREDARFCGDCGATLASELICANCRRFNSADQRFCDGCGQRLESSSAPLSPHATTAPPHPNSSSRSQPTSFADGRYEVQRFLGEGGKKKVYLAHDSLLDRDVAFALIKTEGLDEAGRTRISREAQAMGRLGSHPHIVTVFDLGLEEGQPYMVSELMGGVTWRAL